MQLLIRLLPDYIYSFMLVFARVGTLVMLLVPGLSGQGVPAHFRIVIALAMTLMLIPAIHNHSFFNAINANDFSHIIHILITELLIGFTFGLVGRFLMSSLLTAGSLISQQMGLSFTMIFDPSGGEHGQAAVIGTFLSLLGVSVIFASNLHHVAFLGIADTYNRLPLGTSISVESALEMATIVVHSSFAAGVRISAPFLVFAIVFNVGLGLLSRMMPQLQVFFLAMPASVLLGTLLLALVLPIIMDGFAGYAAETFRLIFAGA